MFMFKLFIRRAEHNIIQSKRSFRKLTYPRAVLSYYRIEVADTARQLKNILLNTFNLIYHIFKLVILCGIALCDIAYHSHHTRHIGGYRIKGIVQIRYLLTQVIIIVIIRVAADYFSYFKQQIRKRLSVLLHNIVQRFIFSEQVGQR